VSDVEENRQGKLTEPQKQQLTASALRRGRRTVIYLTLFITFFVIAGTIPNTHSIVKAVVIIVVLETLFLWGLFSLDRKTRTLALAEIAEGKLDRVTGVLEHRQRSRYSRTYYVEFAGKTLLADLEQIDPVRKTLEQVPHNVYYLPRSQRVITFERAS
jgi:hypothetical protein